MERHPRFHWSIPPRGDGTAGSASPGRCAAPSTTSTSSRSGEDRVPYLLQRARRRAPRTFKLVMRLPGMAIGAGLAVLGEGARPLRPGDSREPRRHGPRPGGCARRRPRHAAPDAKLDRCPVRAQRRGAGVPTAVCIASWDNLSSKQLLRCRPRPARRSGTTSQKQEAVTHPRVPATGSSAPARNASTTGSAGRRGRGRRSARASGLDPAKPYVLYVGGRSSRLAMTEAEFCLDWIDAVRASDDPALRGRDPDAHTRTGNDEWRACRLLRFEHVASWPPTRDAGRGGHEGRLLRLDLPQRGRRRDHHERDDRGGRSIGTAGAHGPRPRVRCDSQGGVLHSATCGRSGGGPSRSRRRSTRTSGGSRDDHAGDTRGEEGGAAGSPSVRPAARARAAGDAASSSTRSRARRRAGRARAPAGPPAGSAPVRAAARRYPDPALRAPRAARSSLHELRGPAYGSASWAAARSKAVPECGPRTACVSRSWRRRRLR